MDIWVSSKHFLNVKEVPWIKQHICIQRLRIIIIYINLGHQQVWLIIRKLTYLINMLLYIQLTSECKEKAGSHCHFISSLTHRLHHTVKNDYTFKNYMKSVKSRNTKFFLLEFYIFPQIEWYSLTSVRTLCHLYKTFATHTARFILPIFLYYHCELIIPYVYS